MKRSSASNIARRFGEVMDAVERDQQEVIVVRNRRQIARLIPDASRQNALEIFSDLYRTTDDDTADALSAAIATIRKSRRGRLSELREPWAE